MAAAQQRSRTACDGHALTRRQARVGEKNDKNNLFLCQQFLKLFTAIFFHQFSCFHIAEAHLNIICPQKWHFR